MMRGRERGTSAFELVMLLPAIALVMVFLIGLAQTLILKQHGLVGARYAAFYQRISGSSPQAQLVAQAVSASQETWRLTAQNTAPSSSLGGILDTALNDVASFLGDLISSSSGSVNATAATTPVQGILPRMFQLSDAGATYELPYGTWTNDQCGSYLSMALGAVSTRLFNVNLPGL